MKEGWEAKWAAYKAAQAESDAAYAAYCAAADAAAVALQAYSQAICHERGRALALDSERPLNPGDETAINGARTA